MVGWGGVGWGGEGGATENGEEGKGGTVPSSSLRLAARVAPAPSLPPLNPPPSTPKTSNPVSLFFRAPPRMQTTTVHRWINLNHDRLHLPPPPPPAAVASPGRPCHLRPRTTRAAFARPWTARRPRLQNVVSERGWGGPQSALLFDPRPRQPAAAGQPRARVHQERAVVIR